MPAAPCSFFRKGKGFCVTAPPSAPPFHLLPGAPPPSFLWMTWMGAGQLGASRTAATIPANAGERLPGDQKSGGTVRKCRYASSATTPAEFVERRLAAAAHD